YSTPADMRGGMHIPAADGRHRINLNETGSSHDATVSGHRVVSELPGSGHLRTLVGGSTQTFQCPLQLWYLPFDLVE
ncbi:hypothetical protein, partial [Paraburkholderia piptadeniae]|uniref:hypothetical protein n=1 Tax=Paraburkholderia piptadeniae TaxID=1701573 RepID=UPI001C48BE21